MDVPTLYPKRTRDNKEQESVASNASPLLSQETVGNVSKKHKICVPPGIVNKLSNAQIIGYLRPLSERIMDARYYTINPKCLRTSMKLILEDVLMKAYHDKGNFINAKATTEINRVVPLTVDACMNTVYAKLSTIHKHYGKYSSRFTTLASYNKDIELPLPFADAISEFGIFEASCAPNCRVFVPVFPEGTKYEDCSTEEWNSYKYKSCIQSFREVGIPCRNVDTRIKFGSAWWTYHTKTEYKTFFGTMIVPPLHYSDHSATLASMFLLTDGKESMLPLIEHQPDDEDYGLKFQLLRPGVQSSAFMALAAMPEENRNPGFTCE